jgi:ornithine--oxo-acid transaminase
MLNLIWLLSEKLSREDAIRYLQSFLQKMYSVYFNPGDHGSTFGGNPLGAAIARESLKFLSKKNLLKILLRWESTLLDKLKSIKSKHIKEVRGKGLFIGVELYPEAKGARRFCERLMQEGILCKETHDNVIRFAPPLVIKKEEIDWAFSKIEKVLLMD